MALIDNAYAPPGVYTTTVYNPNTAQLSPNARIAVLIGEGEETFTRSNVELHRGSSATADDQVVGENVSDQATGPNRTFQLTYSPVVAGDGTGKVTNDVSKIQVLAGGLPVPVVALDGNKGTFTTQTVIPAGTNVVVNYFFKKTDTQIQEDMSAQVPSFASLTVASQLTLGLSIPGALGNNVSFALTLATGSGVSDLSAVTGAGTDTISIELREANGSVRTYQDIINLLGAGVTTASGGYITIVSSTNENSGAVAHTATRFTGGAGQSTNTVFKTALVPVVDGTNGGVVTTNPGDVVVLVNGIRAVVTALDGANGLVTLGQPVDQGSTVEITYFTNKYQDTADLLPSANVASIEQVGFGQNRSDFAEGTDYVLNGNSISWGASVNTTAGQSTLGFAPFNATVVSTTLVDEKVYLQPVTGAVSGRNSIFTLADVPVDGSGLGRPTDNPALIQVYVGADPVSALNSGAAKVARLAGASAQVTLFNPPAQGQNVYATYYRSALDDHQFTLTVNTVGSPGQGSYTISTKQNQASTTLTQVVPSAKVNTESVADANFTNTGIVWPHAHSDLAAAIGGADETVTLTFQDDALATTITQATQASLTVADSSSIARIQFRATNPGTAGNEVTIALVGGPTGAQDGSAITITGSAITVATVHANNSTTRTWQEIVNLFATYPAIITGPGQILCTGVQDADLTAQAVSMAATPLSGGAAAVTSPFANRFLVTTSRTRTEAQADGLGLTGGATTPNTPNTGVGASGYLGQTYIDAKTGFKFTLVDPKAALSYGYTQLPSPSYSFKPGDTISFVVSKETPFLTGVGPIVAIPGLSTKVVTTHGMNVGDTCIVDTFNRAGSSPAVGEYYYVTYKAGKQASDYGLQIFGSDTDAYKAYGQPSLTNRLSLAIKLFIQNAGPQQFACIQVPVQDGLLTASDQSFIDAIQSVATPISGSGRKPNVIVPLSTSPTVQQFLSTFLTKQATARNKGEATGFVGFDRYATVAQMRANASAIANQRIIAVAPNLLGMTVQSATSTVSYEAPVTGEFAAVALAGLMLASGNDVATTLTGQNVVGFTRGLITFDEPTKNLLATAGITVLNDSNGALEVRHYKTTDPNNALTSEPYVTTTADFINQSFRSLLAQFRGRKMTADLPNAIQAVLNAQVAAWNNDIISAYGAVSVVPDKVDPTTINISVPVRPMFSLLWMNVTLTVNISQ